MLQKGLAPILVILLLAVTLGGYLIGTGKINLFQRQATQNSKSETNLVPSGDSETANWKTYTRNNLFEIKYPSQWNVIVDQSNDSVIDFSDGIDIPRGPNTGYIDVKLVLSSPGRYIDVFKRELGSIEKGSKNTITVLEKSQIDNYPSVKLLSEKNQGVGTEYSYQVYTYIQHSKMDVSISALKLNGSNEEFENTYLPIYNQMLSTFKFTQ